MPSSSGAQSPSALKIAYDLGDICENSENILENELPRKVNFLIKCGELQDAQFS